MHENQKPTEKENSPAADTDTHNGSSREVTTVVEKESPELDDFGLLVKRSRQPNPVNESSDDEGEQEQRIGNGNVGSGVNGVKDRALTGEQNENLETPVGAVEPALDTKDSSTSSKHADDVLASSPVNKPTSDSFRMEEMFTYQNGDGRHPVKGVSEWSHQQLAPHNVGAGVKEDEQWQDMPAFAPYDLYDDNGKLVAREAQDSDDEAEAYGGLGGAGKGYTRVQIDDDARSATSMDENTSYLFKEKGTNVVDEDEEQRDPLAQMQATKDLLTEGQRIAYVGVTRLAMVQMVKELEDIEGTKSTKKDLLVAVEAMKMWSQKMMVRLYAHMEIDPAGNCPFSIV